jgi:hypothetical protein
MKKLLFIFLIPVTLFALPGCTASATGDDELDQWHQAFAGSAWSHYRSVYIGNIFSFEHVVIGFCPDGRALYEDKYTGRSYNCTWTLTRDEQNMPLLVIVDQATSNYWKFQLAYENGSAYLSGSSYSRLDEPFLCQ